MSKSTKSTGTKTTTKGTAALAKTQAKAAKRVAKIAGKHEAIRKAGKAKTEPAILPICPACKSTDVVVTKHGQSCSACGHNEPNDAKVSLEQEIANAAGEALANTAAGNRLLTACGLEFTDALNAATVEQLEEALKHPGLSNQYRNRVGIALKLRTAPADDVAKTVAAVQTGDLTKGIEVPTAGKKKATPKSPRPTGKMSGLDAAVKVLAESAEPMNAKQIVEATAAKGYWSSNAATPHATIYAAIIVEIAKKGDQARFKKTDRGLFTVTAAGQPGKQAK